jgi:hypothetical protein
VRVRYIFCRRSTLYNGFADDSLDSDEKGCEEKTAQDAPASTWHDRKDIDAVHGFVRVNLKF